MQLKPMLATTYDGRDIHGWLISEKFDGVWARWDGGCFTSRNGKVFNAPAHMLAGMPNYPLDGELTMGRGMFSETVSAVRSKASDWPGMTFMVFDAVVKGMCAEHRQRLLSKLRLPLQARMADQWPVSSHKEVHKILNKLVSEGAEGVVLRDPAANYTHGHSSSLMKLVLAHTAEAKVCGINGPNSIALATTDGIGFNLALNGNSCPQIGATVTYEYRKVTKAGKPIGTYVGVRDYE